MYFRLVRSHLLMRKLLREPYEYSIRKVADSLCSRTEPDTFFFNVHLNAQPTALAKDKQKASNALVLSTLAYSGGPTEFAADMGPEVSLPSTVTNVNHAHNQVWIT